jgi:hypothetical protein
VLILKAAFWFLADARVWADILGERADLDVLTPQQVAALFPLASRN